MDPSSGSLAAQTEIPVSNLPNNSQPTKSRKTLFIIAGVIAAIVVVLIGVVVFINLRNNSRVKALSGEIYHASQKGDYKTAQKKATEALKIDKNSPVILSQMIDAISLEGNQSGKEVEQLKKSKPYIDKALDVASSDLEVLLAAGYAYETAGEYGKAHDLYSKAVKLYPKSSDAYFNLGHVSQFLGKKEDATKYYKKAYELNPKNPQVLMVRGNMFFSEGKLKESYEAFKKASEDPNISNQIKAEALVGASLARVNQDGFKHIVEATELSKRAVESAPNFSPALGAYGYNLFLGGKQRTGFYYIVNATEANPRISRNYFLLSMIYRTGRDYNYAITAGKEAIYRVDNDNTIFTKEDKDSQKAMYQYELARTYSLSGLNADTTDLLNDAVSLQPSIVDKIRVDYEGGKLFQENATNPNFLSMIQT